MTIITSNAEKELPDAFLRRCIFHFIEFPTPQLMEQIVEVHFPNLKNNLLKEAMRAFYALREIDDFAKTFYRQTGRLDSGAHARKVGVVSPRNALHWRAVEEGSRPGLFRE